MAEGNKLIVLECNLTGDKVSIYPEYYKKKIEQYGSEENLKNFYIQYKIIALLKRGYSLESIANTMGFNLDESKQKYYTKLIKFHKNNTPLLNNKEDAKVTFLKTDPEVKSFLVRFAKVVNLI